MLAPCAIMSPMDDEPIFQHSETGETFTAEDVERFRAALERETGLDLHDMKPKGVIANYLARRAKEDS